MLPQTPPSNQLHWKINSDFHGGGPLDLDIGLFPKKAGLSLDVSQDMDGDDRIPWKPCNPSSALLGWRDFIHSYRCLKFMEKKKAALFWEECHSLI